jgi:DNA-binding transcriptional LysR family regulator
VGFNNTNWNLYKTFIVAYETKSMHKASEILGITRSAISQNIKELGNQIGLTLFTATPKGIVPTGEATAFYEQIRVGAEQILCAENDLKTMDENTHGIIKISVPSDFIKLYIKDYLKIFCALFPNIRLDFIKRSSFDLLASGEIDFVIDPDYKFANTDFKTKQLFNVTDVFIVSKEFLKSHNLPRTITQEKLLTLPIIAQPQSWNFKTPPYISTTSSDLVFQLTKMSVGIGCYCKELFDKIADPDLLCLDIKDLKPVASKIVCGYKNLTRPAKEFIIGLSKFTATFA